MLSSEAEIVEQLNAATRRPYLVGIDGRSGAGKSVLADRICQQLTDAVVVRKDDFYRMMDEAARSSLDARQGYDRYFDWDRLRQQVLLPIAAGQTARYQRYDWTRQELAETIEVAPRRIVIVEGVYATRLELKDFYDLRI
ncbi:MAG TPA: AAA family ATPase [Pirellulales bacterium]|jgi:uridine kinase|nr:AAA family ATPase [Pirellulales bacterium]